MKKSELVKMIREEVASLLREKKTKKELTELESAVGAGDETAVAKLGTQKAELDKQIAAIGVKKAAIMKQMDALEKK